MSKSKSNQVQASATPQVEQSKPWPRSTAPLQKALGAFQRLNAANQEKFMDAIGAQDYLGGVDFPDATG